MLLGAHESVAGGLHLAFERGLRDGCQALQVWTRSSRQWSAAPLEPAMVALFRAAHRAAGGWPTAAHASYLINLCATTDVLWARSIATLTEECERAELLGIGAVIVHPGAHQGAGAAAGVAKVGRALRQVCAALRGTRVRLLLECTAGMGSSVGASFEELAGMLDAAGERRLGICLDTQHMWAAGIDWTTARGYAATFERFDRLIGMRHLRAFHLNDSKRPLGSRVDRHQRIGDGAIGLAAFSRLVNDARFADVPGFLETPPLEASASGEPDGKSYAQGLERLRSLRGGRRRADPGTRRAADSPDRRRRARSGRTGPGPRR